MLVNIAINKMRNLNPHVQQNFGKENFMLLCKWEELVKQMQIFITIGGSCLGV